MNFAESNDRVFSVERTMIDAEDDAASQCEADTFDAVDRLTGIYDQSAALHEFILHSRYERDVRAGKVVEL